jgi:hypothetical protein
MKPKVHPQEFREQALRKLRERGNRTQQNVADELNISLATLKGWLQASAKAANPLPSARTRPNGPQTARTRTAQGQQTACLGGDTT